MKKLLYLFLAITIISCGGDDDGNTVPNGTWTGTFQTDAGDSGTWTATPLYEDGDYTQYSGEIISELYGSNIFDVYTDEAEDANSFFGSCDIYGTQTNAGPEYTFEAYLNGNSLINARVYTESGYYAGEPIGTFTGTKN